MAEEAESTVSGSPSAGGGLVMERKRQKTGENVQTTIAAVAATILTVVTLSVAVACWLKGLIDEVPAEERVREEAKAGLEGPN